MNTVTPFAPLDSSQYDWADEHVNIRVNPDRTLFVGNRGGSHEVTIPIEIRDLVQGILNRLRNSGDFPPVNLNIGAGLRELNPQQMGTLFNVVNSVKGSLASDTATAMLAISQERSQLLNDVVKSQVEDMQKRNQEISRLNNLLQEIRAGGPEKDEGGEEFKKPLSGEAWQLIKENRWDTFIETIDENPNTWKGSREVSVEDFKRLGGELFPAGKSMYGTLEDQSALAELYGDGATPHSRFQVSVYSEYNHLTGESTPTSIRIDVLQSIKLKVSGDAKNKFGELIQNVKTEIDDLSSSAQLDMVKLQGLINKKNQSVELMTTFQNKDSSLASKLISGFNR